MRSLIISALAAAALSAVVPSGANAANFYDPSLATASPLVEQAACRTVTTHTRVNGRVVNKTVRKCDTPAYHARSCSNVRTRVRTPAGTFVYKSVRRCR